MAQLAFGVVGAVIGFYVGGPLGASIGFALGSAAGGALFPQKTQGPRLNDLRLQTSSYGAFIPIVYGKKRIAGNVIDQTDLVPHDSGGGKKDGGVTITTYSASFAILLCEGPINGVTRMWRDGKIALDDGVTVGSDTPLPFTLYLGTEDQLPDPTLETIHGVGHVPAYRGFAYIVFTDLDLSEDGNRIANWEFEVVSTGQSEAFGLKRYSTFAVDPDVFTTDVSYSYPYLLNGQHLNNQGQLVSYIVHADRDYVMSDPHDGAVSYVEYLRNLKGGIISTASSSVPPFPDFDGNAGQGGGFPQIFGLGILGSMNSAFAFASAEDQRVWPDGTERALVHIVDGWMGAGSSLTVPQEVLIAIQPESEGVRPYMGISGTIWYANGALYATGGGVHPDTPETFVRKYIISKGKPSRNYVASYTWPVPGGAGSNNQGSAFDVTSDDDGNIWVMGSKNGVNDPQLYKFDKDLNLLDVIDSPDSPYHGTYACIHFNFSPLTGSQAVPGYMSFTIYRGYIVIYSLIGGSTAAAACFKMNEDHTTTFVNYVEVDGITPIIYLGRGFMAVRDGILSFGGDGSDGIKLSDIVADISQRCGMTTDQFDVTEIPDPVRGFAITNQTSGRANIEALIPAFAFGAVESDDKVRWRHLNRPADGEIGDDDLGMAAEGEDHPPLLATVPRTQEVDLPRSVSVKYNNVDADYQTGLQTWSRQTTRSQSDVTLELPVVMNDAEAKRAADVNGTSAWLERETLEFSTSRKFGYFEPLDIVRVRDTDIRITKKDESRSGVIKWTGVRSAAGVFVAGSDGNPGGFTPQPTPTGQLTDLFLLDIPLPTDDSLPYGVPSPMAGGERSDWRGATIYESDDGGATYQATGTTGNIPDIIGTTTTKLGDFSGGNVFDECGSVTVEIGPGGGTLSSASRTAVLNGANLALVGNEIIQYKTATLVDTDTYTLTGLLRGRRGTEWATSSHSIGEGLFVLPTRNNFTLTLGDIGQSRSCKAVTLGGSVANAEAVDFTSTGVAVRPYAPVQLGGGVNGTGDVTLNWVRRDRKAGAWLDLVEIPLSEATESYVVQIWESSYTVCARIITVTAAQTLTYTSAQQVTDFGAQQQMIYWTVGQLGAVSLGVQARGATSGAGGSNANPLTPIAPFGFPTPIAPIPLPTRTPDHVFTLPDTLYIPLIIGQVWSGQFTTPAGTPRGSISAAEYGSPPYGRHSWISTDSGGLNKVARSESWGNEVTSLVGATGGGAVLAGSTTYYFFTELALADGTPSGVLGTSLNSIIVLIIES